MQQNKQTLLQLVYAKENQQYQTIKNKLSQFTKYFVNVRRNITIAYDKPTIYIIHKQYYRIVDLGKSYTITHLTYNYKKNIIIFYTQEGSLYAYFIASKAKVQIKHDFNKLITMDWIYSQQQQVSFFVAEEGGIHMYKLDEEKKDKPIKQVKHISGKYHCFLYQPITQFLAAFLNGSCDFVIVYHFDPSKAKNWFRANEIQVSFKQDQSVVQEIRGKKRLGLEGNRINKALRVNKVEKQNFIDIRSIHNTPYMIFYYANEGKLQLTPLVDPSDRKKVVIKLPSSSALGFNLFDNMLVIHLRRQKITFVYDINATGFQALVSPYSLTHQDPQMNQDIYESQFISYRAILPSRHISKWKMSISVIYRYLKNEMHIFEFLSQREAGKIQTIKWMREALFSFRPMNLSKMWKTIFTKICSGKYDQSQIISMVEIFSNLFYTLSIDPQTNKVALVNILMECLRQAQQYRITIPNEMQWFIVELLLSTEKFDLLSFLCHQNIIKNDSKIYYMIYEKGQALNDEALITLSIDLAYQNGNPKGVLTIIMRSQRIRETKRFLRTNFQKINPFEILQSAKYLRNLEEQQQFISYCRNFIPRNYPNISRQAFMEAEKKIFQ